MTERRRVASGSPYEPTIGFSRAVRAGDRVLVSGTAPVWPDGSCPDDAQLQAARCLAIIVDALSEAGATPADVVRTRMFLVDAAHADAVGRAHAAVFGDVRPAATMVVVKGLLDPRWLIEIEAEAIVGGCLPLDADVLVDLARSATGLTDLGEDSWRNGLERLVVSLREEARLNDLGSQIAAGDVFGYLSARLTITEWHRQHPEAALDDITPPIVIMGQPRTGTTILFDLLAQDPDHRVPLTWEVDRPLPPPQTATYDTDPRIDEVQAGLDMTEMLIPGFLAMHPLGARLGQECVRITGSDFRSLIFPTQYRVPSYTRWLVYDADLASTYRWHRRFLELLQSGHRADRWLLKSPAHLWSLPALLAEYPGALLVQTHRDPCTIVASVSSLVALLRRMASDAPDITEIADEWVDYIVTGLDRSVDARVDGAVRPDQVVDVHFDAFMADPFATIGTIYGRLGLELTDAAEQRMRAFLAEHGRERHGKHEYTFADTGLDEGAVREQAKRYTDYFAV